MQLTKQNLIKKLEEQIKEAESQIKELKVEIGAEQEAPPVWMPDLDELYYLASINGVSSYTWNNDNIDTYHLEVGNLFETEQEADNHIRALKLIEKIRRERFKAQGKWRPSEGEDRHTMCWDQLTNCVETTYRKWIPPINMVGSWKDENVLKGVIKRYEADLKWYFTEYLPTIN